MHTYIHTYICVSLMCVSREHGYQFATICSDIHKFESPFCSVLIVSFVFGKRLSKTGQTQCPFFIIHHFRGIHFKAVGTDFGGRGGGQKIYAVCITLKYRKDTIICICTSVFPKSTEL